MLSPWKELVQNLAPWLLWLPHKGHTSWLPGSSGQGGLYFRTHRTVANRETLLNGLQPQGSVQMEQREIPISQSFPERSLFAYLKSCYLRSPVPISLHLGDEWYSPQWDTNRSWHILNYWEPLRANKAAWTITKVWETTKSSG